MFDYGILLNLRKWKKNWGEIILMDNFNSLTVKWVLRYVKKLINPLQGTAYEQYQE